MNINSDCNYPAVVPVINLIACMTILLCGCNLLQDGAPGEGTRITVDPTVRRCIGGVSELNRATYFGLCDQGTDFDKRCRSDERYNWLIKENGITFGRSLGLVKGVERYYKAVRENPERPGYVDVEYLRKRLQSRLKEPGEQFKKDMNGRLEVALHGNHNAYPSFMGEFSTKQSAKDKKDILPQNIDAAAEFAAKTLKYKFNDFDRPSFYEPVNEPHWSYFMDQHLAKWHLATLKAVRKEKLDVLVGGPCSSVAYFYKREYGAFKGMKAFIDNTGCGMDFYSFHVYDFVRDANGEFGGRMTSGLPLESVLDLVQNYTVNTYGKEVDIVVSEHGGYGADELIESMARESFAETGFEWEMKMRSINDFNMVSSLIANTLTFMDHPHTVKKAVPFILLESMAWDPKYYAVIYTPRDYKDEKDWVPTKKIMFYRLFRDLKGHRVVADSPDPDVQTRAFVDDNKLFVVLNNLSNYSKNIALDLPRSKEMTIRRFGRNADFTPYLTEKEWCMQEGVDLQARECVLLKLEYRKSVKIRSVVDEKPFYGDRIATAVEENAEFTVEVDDPGGVKSAVLRIGISRPPDAGHRLNVFLNDRELIVPLEECAQRLVEKEYASCKLIPLDPAELRKKNTVTVSFPDGRPGSIGAVVIRASREK